MHCYVFYRFSAQTYSKESAHGSATVEDMTSPLLEIGGFGRVRVPVATDILMAVTLAFTIAVSLDQDKHCMYPTKGTAGTVE